MRLKGRGDRGYYHGSPSIARQSYPSEQYALVSVSRYLYSARNSPLSDLVSSLERAGESMLGRWGVILEQLYQLGSGF